MYIIMTINPVEFKLGSQLTKPLRLMINDYIKVIEHYLASRNTLVTQDDRDYVTACKQIQILVNEQFSEDVPVERDMTNVVIFKTRNKDAKK